ncbi:MAG: phosphopyruvate hydratase [Candidatus Uhrbacteria bacterium]
MARIRTISAWEVLDSRGNPTIRAMVELRNGVRGVASVPSGASTGSHEALELRDGDKRRYGGKGVLKAVHNVQRRIAPSLRGVEVSNLRRVDERMLELDGTEQKSRLGANAILAVSLACARAAAVDWQLPLYEFLRRAYAIDEERFHLPRPMMNIVNGGRHADSGLTVQEFMVLPKRAAFRERVRVGAEVFHSLRAVLHERGLATTVGDEGGFAPKLHSNEQALELIVEAITRAKYVPGKDVEIGMDVAATEFYFKGKYYLNDRFGKRQHPWTAEKLMERVEQWISEYPIVSIEDPLAEDDWKGWAELTKRIGKRVRLIGDDLFVTNAKRLQRGIDSNVANAILIKVNQIGTLSETMDTIALAKENGYDVIISHRSGETADTFIADLAVAVNAGYIKTGSLSRSERVEKYNRLMEIERELAG